MFKVNASLTDLDLLGLSLAVENTRAHTIKNTQKTELAPGARGSWLMGSRSTTPSPLSTYMVRFRLDKDAPTRPFGEP